jgi:L-ascorbate metabolism protein UlaG (beta-lactamase superfamily)
MNTLKDVKWLGHSAVLLIDSENNHIFIDPFLSQNPTTPEEYKHPEKVDFILLTHGHEDHVGDTIELANKHNAKVLSIVELSGLLKTDGLNEDLAVEMNKGGTVDFGGFKVSMTSANHSASFGGRYAGEPAGLVVHFDNHVVYHLGDTNIMHEFTYYKDLYNADIAFVPMGDYYTMGPKEAAMCVEMLDPQTVVPIHYGTFPVLTGTPEEFKHEVGERTSAKVVVPEAGTSIGL